MTREVCLGRWGRELVFRGFMFRGSPLLPEMVFVVTFVPVLLLLLLLLLFLLSMSTKGLQYAKSQYLFSLLYSSY